MFNLFKSKVDKNIYAPVKGKCIDITEVNDIGFASLSMGDGIAIIPDTHIIAAPCDGTVQMIFRTGHAFGIKADNGFEILIHIGIDTVNLEGKGFNVHVKQGDKVKAGDQVISFDKTYVENSSIDMTTMTIFTSGMTEEVCLECYEKQVNQGDILITKI